MRIALLQPSYWPEVRRGSERLVHGLGSALLDRGHEVTLITSHRGRTGMAVEDGIRVIRVPRLRPLPPLGSYEDHLDSVPTMLWRLLRGRYDLAHAFFPSYAWAAVKARRLGAPRVVFSFHGIPERRYLVSRRYRLEMFQAIVSGAAACTVLSRAAAEAFRRYLLVDPQVIPGGVYLERFHVETPRASVPTLICAASLGDPRKRAELLFSAFRSLRERRPDCRLLLVRTRDPVMSGEVPPLPEGAEWIDADRTDDLARAYASSWASVLPSVGEGFGLVLIESLGAGTPVVAARAGSCPEIVGSDSVGRLFEPDDAGSLTVAMEQALEFAGRAGIAEDCRRAAARYDWRSVAGAYERLYESVLERRAGG